MNARRITIAAVLTLTALATGCASTLPDAASGAIRAAFPGATIGKIEVDDEHGLKVHEVALTHDRKAIEVTVADDGTILEVETTLTLADAPEPVRAAIIKAADGAVVHQIEREETRAVVQGGQLVKLDKPVVTYDAEFRKGGKEIEVELTPDGKIIEDDD